MQLKDLNPTELQEFLELQRKLQALDLGELEKAREERLSPREKVIRKLESQGTKSAVTRTLKRGPGRPRLHWKQKKRKHREYMRVYMRSYREVGAPKRKQMRAEFLKDGDWFSYCEESWKKNSQKYTLTRDEYFEYIAPHVGESKPVFFRYDKQEPISLYNVVVKCSDTRRVLYDGKEQQLKDIGAAL